MEKNIIKKVVIFVSLFILIMLTLKIVSNVKKFKNNSVQLSEPHISINNNHKISYKNNISALLDEKIAFSTRENLYGFSNLLHATTELDSDLFLLKSNSEIFKKNKIIVGGQIDADFLFPGETVKFLPVTTTTIKIGVLFNINDYIMLFGSIDKPICISLSPAAKYIAKAYNEKYNISNPIQREIVEARSYLNNDIKVGKIIDNAFIVIGKNSIIDNFLLTIGYKRIPFKTIDEELASSKTLSSQLFMKSGLIGQVEKTFRNRLSGNDNIFKTKIYFYRTLSENKVAYTFFDRILNSPDNKKSIINPISNIGFSNSLSVKNEFIETNLKVDFITDLLDNSFFIKNNLAKNRSAGGFSLQLDFCVFRNSIRFSYNKLISGLIVPNEKKNDFTSMINNIFQLPEKIDLNKDLESNNTYLNGTAIDYTEYNVFLNLHNFNSLLHLIQEDSNGYITKTINNITTSNIFKKYDIIFSGKYCHANKILMSTFLLPDEQIQLSLVFTPNKEQTNKSFLKINFLKSWYSYGLKFDNSLSSNELYVSPSLNMTFGIIL